MTTVLITGANRGIGLEFVRQYAMDGARVHACCRRPEEADDLSQVGVDRDVVIHPLDVSDQQSIHDLAGAIDDEAIDVLVNNAGIYGGESQGFGEIDYDDWEAVLRTNTIGPYRVAEALADRVAASREKKSPICRVAWRASTTTHPAAITFIAQPRPRSTWWWSTWRATLPNTVFRSLRCARAGSRPTWAVRVRRSRQAKASPVCAR